MSQPLEPTVRKGCATGSGYKTHKRHNEIPCEACREGRNLQARTWRLNNFDRYKETYDLYVEKNKQHIKQQKQEYREKNKERIKEYTAKYQQEHAEEIRLKKAEYKKNNPELIVEITQRRRAKIYEVTFEKFSVQDVLETYGTLCHICQEKIDLKAPRSTKGQGWEKGLHLDHVIPISKGGDHTLANVKPAHAKCNMLKHVDI